MNSSETVRNLSQSPMLRSAFVNPDYLRIQQACSDLNLSSLNELKIFTAIQISLFLLLFCIMIKQRRAFHPFFSIFLGLMIVSYLIVGCLALLQVSTDYLEVSSESYSPFLFSTMNFFYYFVIPVNVMCSLERLFATYYFKDYESRRPWMFLLGAIFLGSVFSISIVVNIGDGSHPIFFSTSVQNFLYLSAVISLLVSLLVVSLNIYLSLKSSRQGHSSLTARYQLNENIKAVRVILPFLCFDNLITLTDLLTERFYGVSTFYEHSKCLTSAERYVTVFTIIATIRHLLVLGMPLSLLSLNSIMYRPILSLFQWLHCKRKSQRGAKIEFKNALGKTIGFGQSQDEYFAQLAKSW